jgi:hypothetical protein
VVLALDSKAETLIIMLVENLIFSAETNRQTRWKTKTMAKDTKKNHPSVKCSFLMEESNPKLSLGGLLRFSKQKT